MKTSDAPTISRAGRRLLVCLALGVSLVAALTLHADPADEARDLFKQAIDAVESGRWEGAEELLRSAVALDPVSDRRTFSKDYLPHYWLGVALQERGKCRAALEAWGEAASQGVATESRDALDLPRRRALCEDAIEKLDAAVTEAQSGIEKSRRADLALAELSDAPELAAHWAPFENRRQAALQTLVEAERRLQRFDQEESLEGVHEVADDASQVASRLHTVAADARAKAGQVSSASDRAQGDLEEAEAAASSALRAVQALEPLPPRLEEQALEVRRLLAEVDAVRRRAAPREIRRHSRALAEAIRVLKNLASPPPTWLADAAQSFLDQDFAQARRILDAALGRGASPPAGDETAEDDTAEPITITIESERERFHALLLSAAVRYELWIAGGEKDDDLRREVDDEIAAAVALEAADASVSLGAPSRRFVSPKVRALWVIAGGSEVPPEPAS